jgi:hypothetical protein
MAKETWSTDWEKENRIPGFEGVDDGGELWTAHGPARDGPSSLSKAICYLWGNKPALGVGPLAQDLVHPRYQDMLFAASGDLRDAATMVNAVRAEQQNIGTKNQKLHVVLNDISPPIVLRNLLLLILLGQGEIDGAIQLWFSPRLTKKTLKKLMNAWRKYFMVIFLDPNMSNDPNKDYDVHFELQSGAKVSVCVPVNTWKILMQWFFAEEGKGLEGAKEAYEKRKLVTKNPARKDWYHRYLYCIRPDWRNAYDLYEDDGVVAPFQDGALRDKLECRNPYEHPPSAAPSGHDLMFWCIIRTLFSPISSSYMYYERASPLAGWPVDTVLNNSKSPAPQNDIYGHLYYYVYEVLRKFSEHLTSVMSFTLTNTDARKLPELLTTIGTCPLKFDFIDVSNITDLNNMGLEVLKSIGRPLLKPSGMLNGLFMSYPRFRDALSPPNHSQARREDGDSNYRAASYGGALWRLRTSGKILIPRPYHSIQYRFSRLSMDLQEWGLIWESYSRLIKLNEITAENGFEIKRCVRPWVLRKANLMSETDMVKAGLKLEELVLGEIRGLEVYVQWVWKGSAGVNGSRLENIEI